MLVNTKLEVQVSEGPILQTVSLGLSLSLSEPVHRHATKRLRSRLLESSSKTVPGLREVLVKGLLTNV